ncbi:hypothetical protein [Kitasatospora kifunensis]|uniref:Uncharacterized protein n=1 Tax=Kitasatospora kifunensis TaxID=58351 RepID=A0A7W7RBX9_KITKI|nr:hypothetical protein [Kitasatospora kifunensis]MBB4929151.1 hypothetical protein [Kitasatospora kifunensis]
MRLTTKQKLDQVVVTGRPAMGKQPLPAGATAEQLAVLLKRAVYEIDCRKAGQASRSADYVVFIDQADVLSRFPDDEQLRDLITAVSARGPALGVRMTRP